MNPLSRTAAHARRHAATLLFAAVAALSALAFLPPAAPAAPLSLDVRPENRRILLPGGGETTLQIEISAPDFPDREVRRGPLNLAVVVDRSGSMAEARKLDYAKAALHQLVDRLSPGDVLSVVAYDDRVEVPWPAAPVYGRRESLHRVVEGIFPRNRTFLSGGLEEGFRQAEAGRRRGSVNRILLLSDGLANVGVSDVPSIRRRASAMAEEGVSVSTFGVGNDFDEELLQAAASGGGGGYHYLADPEKIASALDTELCRASRVAANEVEILIRLRPGCRFRSTVGRESRREGDLYAIRLGDLSAGERRTVFAAVEVAGTGRGSVEVGDVSVRYRDPATAKGVSSPRRTVSLEGVRDEAAWRAGIDRAVVERRAVAEAGETVAKAARLADQGKKEAAQELLGQAAAGLSAAPASPAVMEELRRTKEYGRKLESLGDMSSDEAKRVQKSIKYRAYERLERN